MKPGHTAPGRALSLACALLLAAGALTHAAGERALTGLEIASRVNARDDGAQVSRTFEMVLITERGKTRRRVTRSFRRDFGDERRSVLFFEEPPSLEGTALLTYDYPEVSRDDDQWIFLSALRKSRRVASADRGRSFLGTDFSYEDIKKDTRLGIGDYRWRNLGSAEQDGVDCWRLEAIPVDEGTARTLGYGRVVLYIDRELWMARRAEYWNVPGQALKTVVFREIRPVEGVWTAHRIEAENLRTGHRTQLIFRDVDYHTELADDLFTEAALSRGAP